MEMQVGEKNVACSLMERLELESGNEELVASVNADS